MNNKKVLLLILSLIVFVFVACSNKVSKLSDSEIIVNLSVEPKTIDPSFNAQIYGVIYIQHVFEGLTTRDKNNKVVEGVAESWDISQDGKIYTFHLRTNSLWSDGKPVVAEDFVYSWRREVDPVVASEFSYQHEAVKNARDITAGKKPVETLGVKAIDDYTLEVELEAPTAYFLELTAFPTYAPLRKDIIEKYGDKWTLSPESYIGNGPYIMSERNIDKNIVMTKSTNYWNADTIIADKITFMFMQDGAAAIAGIKEGSLHLAYEPPQQDIPTLTEEGLIQIKPLIATYYYPINVTNQYLKDARVRKALSLVIDRNYIVEKVALTAKSPTSAWVPVGAYDVEGDFRENGGEYLDISKEGYSNNVAMAKQLMAEAGYTNGEGFPVLEYKTTSDLIYIQVAEAIQQMWKENLGVDLQIASMEWAAYQQMRKDKDYQLIRTLWIGDYSDPMTFLENYLSYRPQNYAAYSNGIYDRYLEIARNSSEQSVRMEAMHNAERVLIAEDNILIPIYNPSYPLLVSKRLKDYVVTPMQELQFHYAYLE